MKKIAILCAIALSAFYASCKKETAAPVAAEATSTVPSAVTAVPKPVQQEEIGEKYKVCVETFASNFSVEGDLAADARARVLAGLKSNPQNKDVAFTNSITPDCQAIVYGVIASQRTTKIDAQDVVVAYRLNVQVINPKDNAEIGSFAEYSDRSIENAARMLNLFPPENHSAVQSETVAETEVPLEENEPSEAPSDETEPPSEETEPSDGTGNSDEAPAPQDTTAQTE